MNKLNGFRIAEFVIILLCMFVIFAALAQGEERIGVLSIDRKLTDCPAGYYAYHTYLAGYAPIFTYAYTRQIIVCVGPVEQVPGRPIVPELDIRRAIVGVHEINSVPSGLRCDPNAPLYFEYGEELFGTQDCQ